MADRSGQGRRAAERRVRIAEHLAPAALVLKGYSIPDLRARTRAGEIDLIARRGGTVAFVEVKARATIDQAVNAVRPQAPVRIQRAAKLWMARRPDLGDLGWRYDIMAVPRTSWPRHVRDAWRPGFDATP